MKCSECIAVKVSSHFLAYCAKRRLAMKQGDHVKVIGRDGFYIFLKELHGMATLQAGGAKTPHESILAIPISLVVSLEKT
jgi:hypothetical protein